MLYCLSSVGAEACILTLAFSIVTVLSVILIELILSWGLLLGVLVIGFCLLRRLISIYIFARLLCLFIFLLITVFINLLLVNLCGYSVTSKELWILIFRQLAFTWFWVFLIRVKLCLSMLNPALTDDFSRNYLTKVLKFNLILVFKHLRCSESRVLIFSKALINESSKYRVYLWGILLKLTSHNILLNLLRAPTFEGIPLCAKVKKTTAKGPNIDFRGKMHLL